MSDLRYFVDRDLSWSPCRCEEQPEYPVYGCLCQFNWDNPSAMDGVGTRLSLTDGLVYIMRDMNPSEARDEYLYKINHSGNTFYLSIVDSIDEDAVEGMDNKEIIMAYFMGEIPGCKPYEEE